MDEIKNNELIKKLLNNLNSNELEVFNSIFLEYKIFGINKIVDNIAEGGVVEIYIVYPNRGFDIGLNSHNSFIITYHPYRNIKKLISIYHTIGGHRKSFLPDKFDIIEKPKLVKLLYLDHIGKVEIDLSILPPEPLFPTLHVIKISDWLKFQFSQITLYNRFNYFDRTSIIGIYHRVNVILPVESLFKDLSILNEIATKENQSVGFGSQPNNYSISIFQNKIIAKYSFSYYQGDNPKDKAFKIVLDLNDLYDLINKNAIYRKKEYNLNTFFQDYK